MAAKSKVTAQNPLLLRCNRLMEAFAKSDDERDFYIDRQEGFLLYADLDKPAEEIDALEKEILNWEDRFILIPKMTFYETKKIMEGFVNEKVYDIDTKEKLLDIIQSKDARDNFLEFIFDHHHELEKWQTYYQERSRVRIIEWLRANHFIFVFEEDLDFPRSTVEKIKQQLFETKASKEVLAARKTLEAKSKTYYSTEALNPRPKRGRPPKQAVKQEVEPQFTVDIYTTVPPAMRPFLFTPDISAITAATFSSKFESEEALLASRRSHNLESSLSLESINQKLASLRTLASKWTENDPLPVKTQSLTESFDLNGEKEEDELFALNENRASSASTKKPAINGKAPIPSMKSAIQNNSATIKQSQKPTVKQALVKETSKSSPAVKPKAAAKAKPTPQAAKKKAAPAAKTTKQPQAGKSKFRPMKKLKSKK